MPRRRRRRSRVPRIPGLQRTPRERGTCARARCRDPSTRSPRDRFRHRNACLAPVSTTARTPSPMQSMSANRSRSSRYITRSTAFTGGRDMVMVATPSGARSVRSRVQGDDIRSSLSCRVADVSTGGSRGSVPDRSGSGNWSRGARCAGEAGCLTGPRPGSYCDSGVSLVECQSWYRWQRNLAVRDSACRS